MKYNDNVKLEKTMTSLTKVIVSTILSSFLFITIVYSDDSDLYDKLVAMQQQIDELSHAMNARTSSGDAAASEDDLEALRMQVKELRGRIEELEHGIKTGAAACLPTMQLNDRKGILDDHSSDSSTIQEPINQLTGDVGEDDIDDLMMSLGSGAPSNNRTQNEKNDLKDQATRNADKNAPTSTLDIDNATAQYNQALALYNKGEFAEAEEAFRYYVSQYKTGKHLNQAKLKIAHCGLALAKEMEDKPKSDKAREMVKDFATSYKSNPKGAAGAEALLGMGEAMSLQGDSKKACLVLKKLKSDFPKEKTVIYKANNLLKQNRCS